ncbi:hypothetical protein AHF37_10797 [Paragonimus kellicotti]|nr:hypothetical protein AHF37_10797 [Paragonimus kellicotti]
MPKFLRARGDFLIVYVSTIPAYNTDRRPSLIGPRAALEVGRCQPQLGSLDRIVNSSDRSRVPFRPHRTSEGALPPNAVPRRTSVHPGTGSFELSRIEDVDRRHRFIWSILVMDVSDPGCAVVSRSAQLSQIGLIQNMNNYS